jgi:type II secretory pathway component PulM
MISDRHPAWRIAHDRRGRARRSRRGATIDQHLRQGPARERSRSAGKVQYFVNEVFRDSQCNPAGA